MPPYNKDGVVVRKAVQSDIVSLKDRLREEDEKEIIAAGNADGEEVLTQSFSRSSVCYTVDLHGIPVAMFGIVPDESLRSANVWFLGAPEMSKIKKTFMVLSRRFINEFLLQFPVLWNAVDCRYESSIAWLKWCGAEFGDFVDFNGQPFVPFVLRRPR